MVCLKIEEKWVGNFSLLKKIYIGKGILTENKKEFFVEYDDEGNEIQDTKKRTFEGIRLMIIGNR